MEFLYEPIDDSKMPTGFEPLDLDDEEFEEDDDPYSYFEDPYAQQEDEDEDEDEDEELGLMGWDDLKPFGSFDDGFGWDDSVF